jgi:hypothetical protein
MKEGFPQMVTDLDGNKRSHSDIVTQIQQILLPKSREITPLRSPQILVLSLISNFNPSK